VQHGGRGNGHFGRHAFGNMILEELEVSQLDVFLVRDFVDDFDHGGSQLFCPIGFFDGHWDVGLHAAELL
jgi:hypothetical protein